MMHDFRKLMRCHLVLIIANAVGVFSAVTAHAQHSQADQPSSHSSEQTIPDDREAITRDSAAGLRWMVPARQDLSRYTTPGMCLSAVAKTDFVWWRRLANANNALSGTPEDSVSKAAYAVGKSCLAKFDVNTVPVSELTNLRNLALMMNDVSRAEAAVARSVANAPDEYARLRVWYDAIEKFAGMSDNKLTFAKPLQLAAAETLLAKLNASGRLGPLWGYRAVERLNAVYQSTQYDTAAILRNIGQQLAKVRAAHYTQDEIITVQFGGLGAQRLTESAISADVAANLPTDTIIARADRRYRDLFALEAHAPEALAVIGPDVMRDQLFRPTLEQAGKSVPPLKPTYWFVPGDTLPKDSLTYPAPGKLTLFVKLGKKLGDQTYIPLSFYRHLYDTYAKDGLTVVIVSALEGHAFSSGPLDPLAEAKVTAWFFNTYLKAPFPVAIYAPEVERAPDGRLMRSQTAFDAVSDQYLRHIVDRNGHRYLAGYDGLSSNQAEYEAAVRRLLGLKD